MTRKRTLSCGGLVGIPLASKTVIAKDVPRSYRGLYPRKAKRSLIMGYMIDIARLRLNVNDSGFACASELKWSLDNPGDGHFESISY